MQASKRQSEPETAKFCLKIVSRWYSWEYESSSHLTCMHACNTMCHFLCSKPCAELLRKLRWYTDITLITYPVLNCFIFDSNADRNFRVRTPLILSVVYQVPAVWRRARSIPEGYEELASRARQLTVRICTDAFHQFTEINYWMRRLILCLRRSACGLSPEHY